MNTIELDTRLSRAFDRGNYANAYETEDFDQYMTEHPKFASEEERSAFVLGFFSSYTLGEMDPWESEWCDAADLVGNRLTSLGIAWAE